MINVFEPDLGNLELLALNETISSKWIGKGVKEEEFRDKFGSLIGVPRNSLVTYNSCTEAFFQLFEFLKLSKDSEVVLPSVSFVGVANAVSASGAQIRFCDIDTATGNPKLRDIENVCNERTRAVVFQHYAGNMGEIDLIAQFCKTNGYLLIEDAAAAIGSKKDGKSAGTFGDYGLWSFDAMKSISCGDGGMLYSRTEADTEALKIQGYLGLDFSSGITRANESLDRWWNFEVLELGRRSILNDLAASIGLTQIARFSEKIDKRNSIYRKYKEDLSSQSRVKIILEVDDNSQTHSLYFLPIWVEVDRDGLANFLKMNGVYTTFRYLPLHLQKIYNCPSPLIESEIFSEKVLLLPMHTNLTFENIDFICDLIKRFYED